MDNIRVAAIQMRAKVGAVASNLSHAESLVREAFRGGAEWVILPEFFTSAGAFAPSMLSAWLPLEGPALELLRKLAREHNGVVGGIPPPAVPVYRGRARQAVGRPGRLLREEH